MAARSTGVFPREGFNLDAECEITTSSASASTTLTSAKTIRVIGIGVSADVVATLGGVDVALNAADADPNGVVIAHVRGALCGADNNVIYTGTAAGVFYELVDGPKR